jgi:hypothetical protein
LPNNTDADEPLAAPARPFLRWNRRFAHWARWLHTYLSMFSFAILLFFAVTGFTLNHAEWFDTAQRTSRAQGTVPTTLLHDPDPRKVDEAGLVDALRRAHGIPTAANGEFQVDETTCSISFKGPGYEADAIIDRASGKYALTVNRFGLVAILNDLHKGRDAGHTWSQVIDFSALFMTFVALTGLTLIFYLTKRRGSGLIALAFGALLCYLIYIVWVP